MITVTNTVKVNKYARKGSVHSSLSHTKITSPFEKLIAIVKFRTIFIV